MTQPLAMKIVPFAANQARDDPYAPVPGGAEDEVNETSGWRFSFNSCDFPRCADFSGKLGPSTAASQEYARTPPIRKEGERSGGVKLGVLTPTQAGARRPECATSWGCP